MGVYVHLYAEVRVNAIEVGSMEIRRLGPMDISDPAAVADQVNEYRVTVDGVRVGLVRHRYGDGVYALLALAARAVADRTAGDR